MYKMHMKPAGMKILKAKLRKLETDSKWDLEEMKETLLYLNSSFGLKYMLPLER